MLLEDVELPNDQTYRLVVWATMKSENYQDEAKREKAQKVVGEIESTLTQCEGIDVDEVMLITEQEITLDQLRLLKRWDFDSLSLAGESVDELPPTL